jgi:hypothetical protein
LSKFINYILIDMLSNFTVNKENWQKKYNQGAKETCFSYFNTTMAETKIEHIVPLFDRISSTSLNTHGQDNNSRADGYAAQWLREQGSTLAGRVLNLRPTPNPCGRSPMKTR